MTEQAPPEQEHWFLALLSLAGYLLELTSMFVQVFLIDMALRVEGMPPTEGKGWSTMGLAMLIYASFFLVVPATLVAMVRASAALDRFRTRSSLASLAFHASATLLPFASYPVMLYERPPAPKAAVPKAEAPPSARERSPDPSKWLATQGGSRTSGAEWAINNGISREEDCKKGRPPHAFVEGCQAQARSQAGRLPQR